MITPKPSYQPYVEMPDQPTIYVLQIPALNVNYSTEPVVGLGTNPFIAERPQGAQSQANFLSGASDIGGFSLRLIDSGGAVTALRRNSVIVGQQALVYQGYRGLPFFGLDEDLDGNPDPQYLYIFTGKVAGFKVSKQGLEYDLDLTDRFAEADFPVFKEEALAAEPFIGGDKLFDVDPVTGIAALRLVDTDGDSMYDCVKLRGNPVDLALKMLLSGGGNGVGEMSGTDYDVWPVWAGAGLTSNEVDITWFEAERSKILTVNMNFVCAGQESAKAFIEEEICKALGGYTLLSGQGEIRIHFPTSPNTTMDLATLDDTNLIVKPQPTDSSEFHITHITYELGDLGDGPTVTLRRASPEYLAGMFPGEERRHEIMSRGLQPDLGGISVAHSVMDALFVRYAAPPPRVKLQTFFKRHLVEAGDVVRLTSKFWTDWDGRDVTGERLLEALSVKTNIDRVEIDAVDLSGPLTAGRRAIISPNTVASTWGAATEADRQYGYIANAATGQFADGTDAFIWG